MKETENRLSRTGIFVGMFLVAAFMHGCYYYVGPAPVAVAHAPAPPRSYDLAWESALRATEDARIQITSADERAGIISGRRGTTDVRVMVTRQDDGKTRVELDMKGPKQQTQPIADDFFRAYDWRMGRR